MRRLAFIFLIVLAAVTGCKTSNGHLHDWKPPGMLMQGPSLVEKGLS